MANDADRIAELNSTKSPQHDLGHPRRSDEEPVTLENATEGAVFRHGGTGAEVVVVDRRPSGELLNVQLNEAEGHGPGWVSVFWTDASDWTFLRWAR